MMKKDNFRFSSYPLPRLSYSSIVSIHLPRASITLGFLFNLPPNPASGEYPSCCGCDVSCEELVAECICEREIVMSASEDAKELVQEQVDGDMPQEDTKSMPSSQDEEVTIKKKYGGILPRKPPLISKDHERAYFDSADWALGKQGAEKPKSPLEALRPKLQPTQQQTRYRKSPCAPADGEDGGGAPPEESAASE
ncbi:hypothetical protein AKJ16_DCAP04821 [Drosera capensis]